MFRQSMADSVDVAEVSSALTRCHGSKRVVRTPERMAVWRVGFQMMSGPYGKMLT